ncbi:type VI secretion system membrane subunit TssM [Aquincola sp. MAHUQ-54]|uniref:Type VI secretion system membrane subunit TssM n=1 Tax=Aquincola agrisoli TaxID=3119538 RepID=A0AAW9QHP9_9BURK
MKRVLNVLLGKAVLGSLAVLALSAIVWWLGPLLAFGADAAGDVSRPLGGVTARAVVIGLMWLAWIGHLVYAGWRRKRTNAELLKGIAPGPSAADQEAQALDQRFRDAVAKLKAGPGGKRWLSGSDALYEMPWYVFVGAPGSGKTTALLHAGLDFVGADDKGGAAVKGVGGTRHCDWWFTSDAVLIDTAGRYALQESDQQVDASAWDNFLNLLRQSRPRRPINGVLLTVNVQDLLQQGATERQEHAAKLRARLHELQGKLGVRPPVYVMVTKADLIAGFMESFDALGKEERDQVWGFTFPAQAELPENPLAEFDAQFMALEARLAAGLVDRLQAERDVSKRAAMFAFPQEFASLKPVLAGFLQQVFGPAPALQDRVNLRGVYFTSGTQEGTPIDRVMGTLSRSFGLDRRAAAATAGGRGKSFFLRRLLQDVVFAEAHLVSANPQAERRRFALRMAGFASIALAATALLVGWAVSYVRNQAYDQEVAAKLPAIQQAVDALPPATSADPAPLAPTLTAVRNAAHSERFAPDDPPLLDTLGLYQGEKLDAGARLGYRRLLEHALLPRVAQRLEERLRAANRDNLEQAYEALKAYLMLYTPDEFDAETLKAWIGIDWDAQFRNLPPEQRAALDAHLDALLAQGAPQSARPIDTALVTSVRDMLASFPIEYRIYSRLKRRFRGDLPEFSVAAKAGPQADKVFERASGEPLSRGVPGFYTREGYVKAFQGSVALSAAQLAAEEQWVFGRRGGAQQAAGALLGNELADRVRRLYLQDYIKTWDAFLADVRLVKLTSLDRSMEVARLLSGVDSPLKLYMTAVAAETTLVPPAAAPTALDKAAQAANQAKADLAKLAGGGPAVAAAAGPVEKMVDDHFAAIRRQVQGQPAPIDDTTKAFGEVFAQLQAVDAAQKSKSPPPPGGGGAAKLVAAQQPEPVRSMLEALADVSARQGRVAERDVMTGELKPIFDFCSRAVANRYPFAPSSRADVLPEDFGQLFGPGGMLDNFYQQRLATLVDTSGATWTYKPLADGSRPAAPAALAEFQRAAKIKEAFFRGGGRTPGFRLDLRAAEMGTLQEVALDIDGQVVKFAPGSGAAATVSWPSQRVASTVRLSGTPGSAPLTFEGPWALFRMFDRFEVQPGPQPEKFSVVMQLEGQRVRFDVTANSVLNPFRMREIQQFRCPGAL